MKYEVTAKRLIDLMEKRGLTASELARLSGVHKSSISQYINGGNRAGNISAAKLAKVLGCDPLYLMGLDERVRKEYSEDEAKKIAKAMYERPELRVLFDASQNASKEDIEQVAELLQRLSK